MQIDTNDFEKRTIRHGEVLMLALASFGFEPEDGKNQKEAIVAHSESGHHHVAVGDVTVFAPITKDSPRYEGLCQSIWGKDEKMKAFWPVEITPFRVNKDSELRHNKTYDQHQTFTLFKGDYAILHKREYDPFLDVRRKVAD